MNNKIEEFFPIIQFKEHILSSQFDSLLLDSRLKFIIYALAGFIANEFGKPLVITSIFRPGDKGVHGYWRGIDIRTYYYLAEEITEILEFINKTLPYGYGAYKTALYHNTGQGDHIHIQVSRNDHTKIIK